MESIKVKKKKKKVGLPMIIGNLSILSSIYS